MKSNRGARAPCMRSRYADIQLMYQFVRTRPTFLKPIYVVTNVDGGAASRPAAAAVCFFLPCAMLVLRCPSIHSLIDITPKQLNHEACCCRPLRHLGRRLRPLAGSCCCKCTCCINFAFWILPLSLCSPASSASCLVDGFVFSLASH